MPWKNIATKQVGNPIDLATALRLANAGNLQVAFAREQVRQALARADRAGVLWLPSIRGGVGFNNHEGAIQQVAGDQIDTNRGAVYFGLGATDYGNGSPIVPGIYANFSLADAIFQPLAAQQFVGARQQAAAAVQNDILLRVALAYLDLLRTNQEATIAAESRDLTQQLADLTGNFAKAGEGLQSDADRMQAELAIRRNDVQRAAEGVAVSSARLAQLLRLDPATRLNPIEPAVVPIDMTPSEVPLPALVAQGLSQRPELAEGRLLTSEAASRLRREEAAPLLPNMIVGVSEGDFASGRGSMFADLQDRFDFDAMAYWELRNFGVGDRAAQSEARSLVEQAQLRQFDVADQIAREVVEAFSQAQARRTEIETARDGTQCAIESHRHNLERIQNV
ncbi:MAG TPA: TolC family protein, partial [Pirellulales bacterium]